MSLYCALCVTDTRHLLILDAAVRFSCVRLCMFNEACDSARAITMAGWFVVHIRPPSQLSGCRQRSDALIWLLSPEMSVSLARQRSCVADGIERQRLDEERDKTTITERLNPSAARTTTCQRHRDQLGGA